MKRILLILALALTATAFAQIPAQDVTFTTFVDVEAPVIAKQENTVTGLCSTGPFTSSAPVNSVIIGLRPSIAGYTASQAPFLLLQRNATQYAFVAYSATSSATLPAFRTERKTYPTVSFQAGTGEVVISGLNWADAADVVDTLANNPALAGTFMNQIITLLNVVIVPVTTSQTTTAPDLLAAISRASTPTNRLGLFTTPEDWQRTVAFVQAADAGVDVDLARRVQGAPPPATMRITAVPPTTLALNSIAVAPLAANDVKRLQKDVALVGTRPAKTTDSLVAGAGLDPIIIVDSPCYTVRLLPAGTGDAFSALEFNARLIAPWSSGHNFARAQGKATKMLDDAVGSTVNISGEVAHNWDFATGADSDMHPRLAFGLIATYDEAETTNTQSRSESAGLKGEFSIGKPKTLFGLKLLDGEETRPTLTFEGHYANAEATGQTDTTTFDLRSTLKAKFRWSQTAFSRIEAAASWSDEKKFGGRDSFAYVAIDLFRMIVRNPLEVSATYTCGRQPPDYKDSCGFKAGVSMASNQ